MSELLASPFFGIALSILAFWVGVRIQKKTGLVVCNPLLIGIVLVVGVLLLFRIPYESYHQGGEIINMFLAPATACLAVAIYGKIRILKENWLPILVGCVVGSASSMGSILLLCRLFGLDAAMTASLLPKSVTTPHCHQRIPGPRRHRPHHRGGGADHRHLRQHRGPAAHQAVPGEGPHDRRAGHRRQLPRGGHLQGSGAGRDRGGHERAGYRGVRADHSGALPVPDVAESVRPRRRRGRSLSKKWQSHFFEKAAVCRAQGLSACGGQTQHLQPEKCFPRRTCHRGNQIGT